MKIEFKARNKKPKRVGRGISAGGGKTAGRGTKGQKSRTGKKIRRGFEGGQNPLIRRIPKLRGFKSMNKGDIYIINVSDLNKFKDGEIINAERLIKERLIPKLGQVKVLGNGDIEKKVTVEAEKFSKQAIEKIKKAGGNIKEIK